MLIRSRVHPNVRFEVEDASTPWTFPKDHFDFIHIRTLGGSIRDFPALLKRCYKYVLVVPDSEY